MKIPSRRSLSIIYTCLLAGSVLVLANCGTTISSHHYGKAAEGTWVSVLPSGYKTVNVNGFTYYVQNGNYFVEKKSRFAVVSSPRSSLREKRRIAGNFRD